MAKPWGDAEKAHWRAQQIKQRDYAEIVRQIDRLRDRFDVREYGRLDYAPESFPLLAIATKSWSDARPLAVVTGGVHGYETSGVLGALHFAERHMADYAGTLDVLVAPCV